MIPAPEIKQNNSNRAEIKKVESGRPTNNEMKNGQIQYRTIKGNLYMIVKHDGEVFNVKMKRMSEGL